MEGTANAVRSHLQSEAAHFPHDYESFGNMLKLAGSGIESNPSRQSFSVQPLDTSRLIISPGSHVTVTSNGRQQTSQSVVNRWLGTLVSMATSDACPQNGHTMDSQTSTRKI